MIKISRGFFLIILGIILYLPVSVVFRMILPFPYGSLLTLLLGPGFFIAGAIFVIKDRRSLKFIREKVTDETKFCGKCGKAISRQDIFCTGCGTESKE